MSIALPKLRRLRYHEKKALRRDSMKKQELPADGNRLGYLFYGPGGQAQEPLPPRCSRPNARQAATGQSRLHA